MGISEMDFGYWAYLAPRVNWGRVRSVCSLGKQEIFTGSADAKLRNLVALNAALRGETAFDAESLVEECSVRAFWSAFGRDHVTLDRDGQEPGSLQLDLNHDSVPPDHRERYDLTTNYGNSLHVANQLNCFKVVHDLTRPGGYMYHAGPCSGMTGFGLFSYNVRFFEILAAANGYEIIDAFMTVDPTPKSLDPHSQARMDQDKPFLIGTPHHGAEHLARDFRATDAGLRIFMRKPAETRPFQVQPYS